MNLEGNSVDALTSSFNALEAFLGDQAALDAVRGFLARDEREIPESSRVVLRQVRSMRAPPIHRFQHLIAWVPFNIQLTD